MRLHEIISQHESSKSQQVDDLNFIVPDQPIELFGQTFEDMQQVTAYCDENDIPYSKEKGCFNFDTYEFPTAKN